MSRKSHVCLLLIATVLLAGPPAAAELSSRDVKQLLKVVRQDKDPAAWAEAVKALREEGEEVQKLLDRDLRRLLRTHERELKKCAERIDKLGGDPNPPANAEKIRMAWEKARGEAQAFIYDEEKLPVATNEMVISDGWETAFDLGREAERTFGAVRKSLEPVQKAVSFMTPESATELRANYAGAEEACRRVAGELGVPAPEYPVREVSWANLEIAEGKLDRAADRFAKMPAGRDRLLVFYAYSCTILVRNDAQTRGLNRSTGSNMRVLNLYRMALGRSPLYLNPKLMRAARGHSEEMLRLKYFGHDSPKRERRNENDRARLEGYAGSVSENIYAAASLGRAIPVWKKSGKHHRTMLLPENIECGVSAVGPVTLVLGAGEDGSPPVLVY